MMMRVICVLLFVTYLIPQSLAAGEYQEIVSTIDNNFYKIDTKSILIQTQDCYEDVQSQQVLVSMDGTSGKIVFSESENTCSVTAVYGSSGYRVGNYRVDITRNEENWYQITDQNIYIRTDSCLIYATEQEGLLSVSTVGKGGGGSLHFEKEGCRVIGLYSPMSL